MNHLLHAVKPGPCPQILKIRRHCHTARYILSKLIISHRAGGCTSLRFLFHCFFLRCCFKNVAYSFSLRLFLRFNIYTIDIVAEFTFPLLISWAKRCLILLSDFTILVEDGIARLAIYGIACRKFSRRIFQATHWDLEHISIHFLLIFITRNSLRYLRYLQLLRRLEHILRLLTIDPYIFGICFSDLYYKY
jgi:hypothetical protein